MSEVFIKLYEATASLHKWTIAFKLHLLLMSADQVLTKVEPDDWKVSCHLILKGFLLLLMLLALRQLFHDFRSSIRAANELM